MSKFRVAAVQMVSGMALEANLEAAARGIAEAAEEGAELVVLPEYFCLMGKTDRDKIALREAFGSGPIQSFLSGEAKRHGLWLVGGTLPLAAETADKVRNAALVFDPQGRCVARYDKIHLFGFDSGKERYAEHETIEAGSELRRFEPPCGPAGLAICYDLRFPELFRALGEVNLIVLPAAFTHTTGEAHWEILLRARAIENQCYLLAAAQGGVHENGRRTWGHSMLVDPWGEVLACLPQGEGVVSGLVDTERIAQIRSSLPALRHRVL
jgi:nitrilase